MPKAFHSNPKVSGAGGKGPSQTPKFLSPLPWEGGCSQESNGYPNPSISLAGGASGRCRVKKGGEGLLLGGSASFLLPYAEQLPQDGGQEGGGAQDYDLHGLPSFRLLSLLELYADPRDLLTP